MKRAVVAVLGLIGLLTPVGAQADPIGINVLSATYSANVTLQVNTSGGAPTTTTTSGSSSVSESLEVHDPFTTIDPNDGSVISSGDYVINASGRADWLGVSEELRQVSNHWQAQAVADFDLTFSPVANGTATLGVDVTRSGEYGSGFGSLFDVTTQQDVWRFYFGFDFGGCDFCPVVVNEGGIESVPGWSSPFALQTALDAADVYDLHLTSSTFNPGFGTFSSVQVSGLVPVPEPSSLILVGMAIAATLASQRRLSRKRVGR